MKNFGFATVAATALAAPTGAGNAQDTISSLSEAGVVSIGEGATFSHTNTNNGNQGGYGPNADNQFAPQNTKTIYVNVK